MTKSEPTTTTGVTPKAVRWIQATFGTDVVWTSVDCRQVTTRPEPPADRRSQMVCVPPYLTAPRNTGSICPSRS